jgi:ABC-type amino acid transport substrate-binding protein
VPLSPRFQEAIDAAAMAAGLIGSDDYTNAFTWSEPQEREGLPQEVANAVAAELESNFAEIDWRATADDINNISS